MKFLNKKEQVIDLEITPYGKSLLSMGRFKPEFYAFYDDEILYDSEYGGIKEHQNSASVRIGELPQLQTQAYFYSAERRVKEAVAWHRLTAIEKERTEAYGLTPRDITFEPYVQDDDVTIGTIPDREFDKAPIGTSARNSSFMPAWDVNVVNGTISSSTRIVTGLDLPIPQLNMSASMVKFTIDDAPLAASFYHFDNLAVDNPLRDKFLNVRMDSVILEINEANANFEWENFDIEIFEVEERDFLKAQPIGLPADPSRGTVTKQFLRPLLFKKNFSLVQDGILLDPDELPIDNDLLTSKYAEYFFEIKVDSEINEDLLCGKVKDTPDGLYSQRTIACEKKKDPEIVGIENLYNTEINDCDGDGNGTGGGNSGGGMGGGGGY